MISLKFVDRVAVAAMFSVIGAIPLAAHAAVDQCKVLNDDTFQAIRVGMPASDVLAIIGAPQRKARFDATRTTAWDYRYRDTWGYSAEFSVIIDDAGAVVGKFAARDSDR
jgi:outer membrane protein assembly factor BamE (lipoprotein component of BamABCDE complex)